MAVLTALELRYSLTRGGHSPFEIWFASLDPVARAQVTVAIARLEQGNLSNVKGVGEGVLEYRINFGPGYRVYFGRDGDDEASKKALPTGVRERGGDIRSILCRRTTGEVILLLPA